MVDAKGILISRFALLAAALALLAACGEVVTPEPTEGPPSAKAPTATPIGTRGPTATAPLLPPPDTATPTVTPTPIVYVVQEGDTLLGIALDYGVSVEALQRANGIENPQALRVGQELIIPTGEEETGDIPGLLLPTPTPLPFGMRGVAFYETPVGSLWCLGEIVNTTAFTITNVQVRVTLFDAAGEPLDDADVFADADLIPPGERSPFRALFTSPPAGWVSPLVTIVRGEMAGELAKSYVPIAVTDLAGQPSDPQFQVSGVVQNASAEQAAGSVSIIVTTYDDQGLVTGARHEQLPLEGPLGPGATAPFNFLLTFHGDALPVEFHVVALGRAPTE
jgi:LysM repeat protein